MVVKTTVRAHVADDFGLGPPSLSLSRRRGCGSCLTWKEFGSGFDRQDVGPSDQEVLPRHQVPHLRACGRADHDDTSLGYDRQDKPGTWHPMAGLRRSSRSTLHVPYIRTDRTCVRGTRSVCAEATTLANFGLEEAGVPSFGFKALAIGALFQMAKSGPPS